MELNTSAISTNIFMARKRAKINQKELSKLTGLSANYISLLENNREKEPSLDTLFRISQATNCTIDELLFENLTALNANYNDKLINEINAELYSMKSEKISFLFEFLKVYKKHKIL